MIVKGIEDEDLREGKEFLLQGKPSNKSKSTFTAIKQGEVLVTRRLDNLFKLSKDTLVIAHWHGQNRTDAFKTTVGELKRLAEKFS